MQRRPACGKRGVWVGAESVGGLDHPKRIETQRRGGEGGGRRGGALSDGGKQRATICEDRLVSALS